MKTRVRGKRKGERCKAESDKGNEKKGQETRVRRRKTKCNGKRDMGKGH